MMEIIYDRKQGKFIRYYIKGNIADIVSLMKSYHPSIWSKLASSLVEMFLELSSTSNVTDMQDTEGNTDGKEKENDN